MKSLSSSSSPPLAHGVGSYTLQVCPAAIGGTNNRSRGHLPNQRPCAVLGSGHPTIQVTPISLSSTGATPMLPPHFHLVNNNHSGGKINMGSMKSTAPELASSSQGILPTPQSMPPTDAHLHHNDLRRLLNSVKSRHFLLGFHLYSLRQSPPTRCLLAYRWRAWTVTFPALRPTAPTRPPTPRPPFPGLPQPAAETVLTGRLSNRAAASLSLLLLRTIG
jgi:hypothetical protein